MRSIAKYRCGFYYDQLGIDQQFLYRKIASSVSCYKSEIDVDEDENSIHKVKLAIQYDNPELFYWSADKSVVKNKTLDLSYSTETEEEAINLVNMVREKRRIILQELSDERLSQMDMFSRVYDYFAETMKYADDELQKPGCTPWIYDIQGPFLHERGVCLGIAQAVNYICMALHIPSILITGEAKVAGWIGNHGWNMVELNGEYFHIDVTCDVCEGERRKYYLKKDKDFADRQWPKTLYPQAV